MKQTYFVEMKSPIGEILVAGTDRAVRRIEFGPDHARLGPEDEWTRDASPLRSVLDELEAYFARDLRKFTVRLDPRGTDFQLSTWRALRKIPYGETRSYADIARAIGRPTATRAVGAANGRNPIPIIVPCHRVIGSDGSLTGFGGGIPTKRKLLALEGVTLVP